MSAIHTLGKNEKLKSRKQIDELFEKGQKFSAGSFRVFFSLQKDPGGVLFAVGAGSRHFKKAVDRNRIKRLTREAWRLQKRLLKERITADESGLHVFLIYTAKTVPSFVEVKENVSKIIDRLIKNSTTV